MAEATIALTAFIFAIYMILSIVDICYVQAKMGIALNSAAKEMSQYAYLYETFELSEYMSGTGGKSSEMMGSFAEVLNKISKGTSNFSSDISSMFAQGGTQAEGDSAAEYLKNGLGMALAKQCVKKNLVSYEGDTPEAFLKRCHVKDGLCDASRLRSCRAGTYFLCEKKVGKDSFRGTPFDGFPLKTPSTADQRVSDPLESDLPLALRCGERYVAAVGHFNLLRWEKVAREA